MNKNELAERFSDETGLKKKDSKLYLDVFLGIVKDTLAQGEKVSLSGFGSFEVRERRAYEGFNPDTGKAARIPASKTVTFKAGKDLKEKL